MFPAEDAVYNKHLVHLHIREYMVVDNVLFHTNNRLEDHTWVLTNDDFCPAPVSFKDNDMGAFNIMMLGLLDHIGQLESACAQQSNYFGALDGTEDVATATNKCDKY
jgi:hypothetical protein